MELCLIKVDSLEWQYMWQWLENHPLNKGLENPTEATHNGESWQYMGTFKQRSSSFSIPTNDRAIHSFRHRNHPVTESIQNVSVQCSDGFTNDQIHREYKV